MIEKSVEDEGNGFNYRDMMVEFAEFSQTLPKKRGLFIVNYLTDELSFNEKGNRVTMVKYLKPEAGTVLH